MLCLGKILQNPESNEAWEQILGWTKSSQSYRNFDRIDGEPTEFECNIFPGFNTLQLSDQVKSLLYRLGETPETTFPVKQKTMKKNVWQTLDSYLCMQEDLVKDNGHSLVLILKRSGTPWKRTVHKESGTIWRKRCCWNLLRADVQISMLRLHLSRGQLKSKGHGKLSIHFAAVQETIETIFRIFASANQLSLYGAIAEMCEEYESLHERAERPVVMGQFNRA